MASEILSATEVVCRISNRAELLYRRGIARGRSLWDIWTSFNSVDNPMRDVDLTPSRAAPVLNLLAEVARNETMIVIVRAFEPPGRGGAIASGRATYPVLAALTRQPGVIEAIRNGALNDLEKDHIQDRLNAIVEIDDILHRLRREKPNRLERLRDFRDEFLAHILTREIPRDEPLYSDVTTMLNEMEALADAAERAFKPRGAFWPKANSDMPNRASELWAILRRGVYEEARCTNV